MKKGIMVLIVASALILGNTIAYANASEKTLMESLRKPAEKSAEAPIAESIEKPVGESFNTYITPKFFSSNVRFEGVDETENTIGVGIAIGGKSGNGRFELEYSIASPVKEENRYLTLENYTTTLFFNMFYDFKNKSKFTPYIGIGIGLGFNTMTLNSAVLYLKETSVSFAWNIGAGISFEMTDRLALDFNYRYAEVGQGELSYSGTTILKTAAISNNQFLLGLRFSF